MASNALLVAKGIAAGRVAYGVACMVAPKVVTGPAGRRAEGPMTWMTRAFGVRDLVLGLADGTAVHRWATGNVKPLPSYAAGAFAGRPRRLAPLRTTGTLFPQPGWLDDELPRGWAAVSAERAATLALRRAGLHVADGHEAGAWLRDRGLAFAILRPDRFVFGCGAARELPDALAAWRRLLGATLARDEQVAA